MIKTGLRQINTPRNNSVVMANSRIFACILLRLFQQLISVSSQTTTPYWVPSSTTVYQTTVYQTTVYQSTNYNSLVPIGTTQQIDQSTSNPILTHFQAVLDKQFSSISYPSKTLVTELKPQLANLSWIPESSISNVTLQQTLNGKTAVTFDVSSDARNVDLLVDRFRNHVNSQQQVTLAGNAVNMLINTSQFWNDNAATKCPTEPCASDQRCWNLQGNVSCVCKTCPVTYTPPIMHFQAILTKQLSTISYPRTLIPRLTTQMAAFAGITDGQISNIVLQEDKTGRTVVTFDVSLDSTDMRVAWVKFQNSVNSQSVITLPAENTTLVASTALSWQGNENCPTQKCPGDNRCWNLQNSRTCQCKTCPITSSPKTRHFQAVLLKSYSTIRSPAAMATELKTQMRNLTGIEEAQILNMVVQKGLDGNTVVTFDVSPDLNNVGPSVTTAWSTFKSKVAIPVNVIVEGTTTTLLVNSEVSWEDDPSEACPSTMCATNQRCWRIQSEKSCVCLTCPTSDKQEITITHFQMTLNRNFSTISNFNNLKEELKPQMASAAGIQETRISNMIFQKGLDGKLVVTFDVSSDTGYGGASIDTDTATFENNVTRENLIKVTGVDTKMEAYTAQFWKDTSNCPELPCINDKRCWNLQGSRSCVCKTCPSSGPTSESTKKGGLDQTSLIIIIVVVSVIALAIIIGIVICIIRSNRRKSNKEQEEYGQGSNYSDDSDNIYKTNFAN